MRKNESKVVCGGIIGLKNNYKVAKAIHKTYITWLNKDDFKTNLELKIIKYYDKLRKENNYGIIFYEDMEKYSNIGDESNICKIKGFIHATNFDFYNDVVITKKALEKIGNNIKIDFEKNKNKVFYVENDTKLVVNDIIMSTAPIEYSFSEVEYLNFPAGVYNDNDLEKLKNKMLFEKIKKTVDEIFKDLF